MYKSKELVVMKFLLQGYQDKKIALDMDLSIQSVKRYIGAVYKKLGVKTRNEFVAFYYQALLMHHAPDLRLASADSKVLEKMLEMKKFGPDMKLPTGIAS